jgi:hexosaminidase
MSPHRSTYFDYPQSADPGEPLGQAGDPVELRAVHAADTAPGSWEPRAAARVLGTQGHLWTEFVADERQAEYLFFPRLCALADRVWNPGSRWAEDFLPALTAHRARLAALGVRHGPIPAG